MAAVTEYLPTVNSRTQAARGEAVLLVVVTPFATSPVNFVSAIMARPHTLCASTTGQIQTQTTVLIVIETEYAILAQATL